MTNMHIRNVTVLTETQRKVCPQLAWILKTVDWVCFKAYFDKRSIIETLILDCSVLSLLLKEIEQSVQIKAEIPINISIESVGITLKKKKILFLSTEKTEIELGKVDAIPHRVSIKLKVLRYLWETVLY